MFAVFGSMSGHYSTFDTIGIAALWLLLPGLLGLSAIISIFCIAKPQLRLLLWALAAVTPSALAEFSLFFAPS